MSLLHALVARGSVVLAEHQVPSQRDFSHATQTILSKIPPNDSKLTYAWEQYLFHYISEGGFVYLVMADDAAGRKLPFAFLADLQRKFLELPSSSAAVLSSTPAYGLQGTFSPVIASLMHTYNTAPPQDEIARAQAELNQVKDIMVQNVEQILSRGERIELLVDKTDTMAHQTTAFRRGARTARRQMRWKNSKTIALTVLVVLVLLYLIIAQFCGAALQCRAAFLM
ncbi:VAMP synaptobrevin-like protein [Pisolithus marmoratus]|nr:VAMP synaptobrevin-like protein [Pisolithus marmoratus]